MDREKATLRRKLVVVTLVAILLLGLATIVKVKNPFNFGISPLIATDEQEQTGRRLEISFSYDNLLLVASNQYAFWIEDMEGNYIDTLYVTRYTAEEGYRRRPQSISKWVSAAEPNDMRSLEIDAITGATPNPGDYLVYWDFTDGKGELVTGNQYRYFIEGTMYMGDDVLYSGIITMGEESWEEYPSPEYSIPGSKYKAMLSNVRVAYYPN
jgi:hypothetical protein